MAGREVREYTNLSDPKDKKWGKGKDRIDDEDITFQRMVAKRKSVEAMIEKHKSIVGCGASIVYKMQEVAGERGGYLHGRGALDSDDLLYLKEQMEAEEDAERLLRRTEKRAFAAFKKAATLADSTPASVPLPLRVEPKPKSGIRQQDFLKKVVEIKPKKPRITSPPPANEPTTSGNHLSSNSKAEADQGKKSVSTNEKPQDETKVENPVKSLLGLAYASSDEED